MKNREREPPRDKTSDGLQAREEDATGNQTERDGEKQRIVREHRAEREKLEKGTARWTEVN